MILNIMCGVPGSGKSTYAHENYPDAFYVSRDDCRKELTNFDEEDYFAHEKEVFSLFTDRIVERLFEYGEAVADATHINPASRKKLINAVSSKLGAEAKNLEIVITYFDISLDTCLERNAKRKGYACVPEEQLKNMYYNFVEPNRNEDRRIIDIGGYCG